MVDDRWLRYRSNHLVFHSFTRTHNSYSGPLRRVIRLHFFLSNVSSTSSDTSASIHYVIRPCSCWSTTRSIIFLPSLSSLADVTFHPADWPISFLFLYYIKSTIAQCFSSSFSLTTLLLTVSFQQWCSINDSSLRSKASSWHALADLLCMLSCWSYNVHRATQRNSCVVYDNDNDCTAISK